jgi:hypothetical protein
VEAQLIFSGDSAMVNHRSRGNVMSEEILICECKHTEPSPMNTEVNAPYTDTFGHGIYATVQCTTYGCQRRFNTRFGYFRMRDGLIDTSGAARKICKTTQACNDEIVFLAMAEGGQWFCLCCKQFEGAGDQAAA